MEEHEGSIRSISALPGIGGFATSPNDGSLLMSSVDAEPIGAVFHQMQEDGSPPFTLDWFVIPLLFFILFIMSDHCFHSYNIHFLI
jgi:hypothetical protein